MKNYEKLMKLNIQLFADEADNDVDDYSIELTDGSDAATDNDTPVDKTKAFSERLRVKTEEARKTAKAEAEKDYLDKLNSVARQQGFDSWEELETASTKQAMRDLGVDEDDEDKFQKLVNNAIDKNPDVIKAKEIIRQSEEEKKQQALNAEINLIHSLDESISSIDDIAALDNVKDILSLTERGYSLYDAYRLCNLDKIMATRAESAKKNALNDVDSKGHLRTSTGGAGKTVHVPKDTYEMYKRNMPKWSDAQIREHYAKSLEG